MTIGQNFSLEVISEEAVGLLTSRGSVTIPKHIRDELGLKTNGACGYMQVKISSDDLGYELGGILFYPVKVMRVEVRPKTNPSEKKD